MRRIERRRTGVRIICNALGVKTDNELVESYEVGYPLDSGNPKM